MILSKKHRSKSKSVTTGRRNVMVRIWQALAALASLELLWVAGSLLKSRRANRDKAQTNTHLIAVGNVDQFKPGEVKGIPQGGFYLVRQEDGSFLALSKTCTHLGCTVPWNKEKQQFTCPCHGSTFDSKGLVMAAPATRPLDYYPLKIENGQIWVNLAAAIKRDGLASSQDGHS